MKVRKVAGFVNYDKSEFESASAVLEGDDAKLEELWKTQYPLKEFTDASNFKSYELLKKRLDSVLMGGGGIMKSAEEVETTSFGSSFKKENSNTDSNSDSSPDTTCGDTEDDALSYFEKLANE